MEEQKSSEDTQLLQRGIKVLCWVPAIGILAELYHVVRWGGYLSYPHNVGRFMGSCLWQSISTAGLIIWGAL